MTKKLDEQLGVRVSHDYISYDVKDKMMRCKRGLDTEFNFKGKAEMAIWRTKKQVYLV